MIVTGDTVGRYFSLSKVPRTHDVIIGSILSYPVLALIVLWIVSSIRNKFLIVAQQKT